MSNQSDNSSHLLMGRTYAWAESSQRKSEFTQKRGLFQLLKTNYTIILFPILGIACTTAAFLFTLWFGRQTFKCPPWANDCKETAKIFVNNYGLVQGIVSTVHGIGMGAIAYAAYGFGLAALWPILHERSCRLNNIDTYLSATRGSIPALIKAFFEFSGARGLMILPFVFFVAILVQVDSAVVGFALNRQNITREFSSNYQFGGGVGFDYHQKTPPGLLPGSITDAMNLYASWSKGLSQEPLPELRDFFMDRDKLQERGDMSAGGMKILKEISCTGRSLVIDTKPKSDNSTLRIKTSFQSADKDTDVDGLVTIRMQPKLTLWVDKVDHVSNTNVISTIIFASVNGEIEGGIKTLSTADMLSRNYTNGISSIQCVVDVKLIDSTFSIGKGSSSLSTVSRLKNFGLVGSNLEELKPRAAAWFGLVAVTNGISVNGAQPMFNNVNNGLPTMFTSDAKPTETQNRWTIDQLKEFIKVSSGALAITMSRQDANEKVVLISRKKMVQLDPRRAYILLAPPIALLISILILAVTVVWFYHKDRIPNMCKADVGDLVAFTQTSDISVNSRTASGTNKNSSELGEMRVKYGITHEGQIGLGCPETVSSFV